MKSDRWRPPDFRSLIKVAQTEQGHSEVSCVFEEIKSVVMARPMIFSDETRPTNFTFANQVGVQTDEESTDGSIPDELARTIQSHLWLANLEMSSGCTPTMSSTSKLPRQPHPDGPTIMMWHQLEEGSYCHIDSSQGRRCVWHVEGSRFKYAHLSQTFSRSWFSPLHWTCPLHL